MSVLCLSVCVREREREREVASDSGCCCPKCPQQAAASLQRFAGVVCAVDWLSSVSCAPFPTSSRLSCICLLPYERSSLFICYYLLSGSVVATNTRTHTHKQTHMQTDTQKGKSSK